MPRGFHAGGARPVGNLALRLGRERNPNRLPHACHPWKLFTFSHHIGIRPLTIIFVQGASSATPAERVGPRRSCAQFMPALPKPKQGRPPHRVFRGLTMFIRITAYRFARRPEAATCLPGSDGLVTSAAAGIASRPERPLPGRDLHPLEHSTFARRTWAATTIAVRLNTSCGLRPRPTTHNQLWSGSSRLR
jgi:hypothetical protein